MSVQASEAHLEALQAAAGRLALAARETALEASERRGAVLARLIEGTPPEAKDLARLMEAEARPRLLAGLREDLRLAEAEARLRLAEAKVAETEALILEAGAAVRSLHEEYAALLAPLAAGGGVVEASVSTPALTQARQRLTDLNSEVGARRDEVARREADLAVYRERYRQRMAREARL
ncbi:MAG TPA: hypothetical protein PLF84_15285 [Bryobacteraceae bacterium]|nr:hypothetical protein [Bryobacterales bacterium]HRJ20411.1 hypothetical protein [Bryobacteraceae bacterium]